MKKAFGCLTLLACLTAAAVLVTSNDPPAGYIGSPKRGRQLVATYGCTSCHEIPGAAPRGMVGPSLAHIASRSYIAGQIPNERIEMEEWLEHPRRMKPGTAMPDVGVTIADSRDIATYLASLK